MSPEQYDLLLTFHRAAHVPIGDLPSLSCDPFLVCSLFPASPSQSSNDTSSSIPSPVPLQFRTPTIRKTLEPEWNSAWIVGGAPKEGVRLELELRDEDPGDHDDILGSALLDFPSAGSLEEGLEAKELELKVQKRKGNARAHAATYLAEAVSSRVSRHARVYVSVRVLYKTQTGSEGSGRMYTLGPHHWSEHFSPLLGHVTGTRLGTSPSSPTATQRESFDFKANQLQLSGPLPPALKFQYVAYRPFIGILFSKSGWRGWALNRALRKQHDVVYSYNRKTRYGSVPLPDPGPDPSQPQAAHQLATRFLEMTSYGSGGRLFTYVLLLDGQWRFTETGEKFAVQFLSKHGMHSDVAKWVAFSGEFFVRRIREESAALPEPEGSPQEHEQGHGEVHQQERDPARYELVIDNDSGTYRPNKAQLPELHDFLTSPRNLCALGKVTVMDGFDEELKRWKELQVRGRHGSGEDGREAPEEAGVREGKMLQHHGSSVKGRVRGEVMRRVEQMAGEHEREEAGE